ncbi:DUF5317 domain-containing protein [Acetivibrio cellulolyticus]|uniref:DUF5317 domain-containing protein n=1 Tax=Acetivibrio cellulolyticus TaxID=35830 RepID=UPI0001E30114|nr:DUF5317 domain-containing protein [Acetivibrio cellulolyticus]
MLYIIVIFFALLIGVAISSFAGRRPSIYNIKFKHSWLLLPGVALQILSNIAEAKGIKFGTTITIMVNGLVFGFVFLVIWINRRYVGLWFIGLGALLNALVMMFNGGRMPVDISLLKDEPYLAKSADLVLRGADNKHVVISSITKIPIFADIIQVPGFLGLGMPLISIGDIIVAVGLFVLCLQFCLYCENIPKKNDIAC